MKRANIINLLIAILSFVVIYIADYFLLEQDINIANNTYNLNYTTKSVITLGIYLLLMIPSILLLAKKVHDYYIKIQKDINFTLYRLFLLISSLLYAYSFVYFDLKYYYGIVGVVILIVLYYFFLKLADVNYVQKANKKNIDINDEVVSNLLNTLGGEDNVLNVSYDYSRLKVEVKDVKQVQLDQIKELGATGLFIAGNKIQAIVGNEAKELENALKKYLDK